MSIGDARAALAAVNPNRDDDNDLMEGQAARHVSPGEGSMSEGDKTRAVRFYVVTGVVTVVIGRIALFSHSVVNRAGAIVMLIVVALCTVNMISLHRHSRG
ncbi:hypothetical protein [Streptomyces sp. NPDC096934]|uniref:hypothetical protein n=1 Tax=Streptomyces sp. NPDC096934 TaxID=3155551 RepID=UPI0033274872